VGKTFCSVCLNKRNAAHLRRRVEELVLHPPQPAKCELCGAVLPPKPVGQRGAGYRFCAECRKARRREADRMAHRRAWAEGRIKEQRERRATPPRDGVCCLCGKTFTVPATGKGHLQKFCSKSCQQGARRAADREQKKRLRRDSPERERELSRQRSKTPRRREYERRRGLLRTFGLAMEQYRQMVAAQGGRCALCSSAETGRAEGWYVDHDHETDQIRGLLCLTCNSGLGLLGDSPERMLRAAEYIEKHARRVR